MLEQNLDRRRISDQIEALDKQTNEGVQVLRIAWTAPQKRIGHDPAALGFDVVLPGSRSKCGLLFQLVQIGMSILVLLVEAVPDKFPGLAKCGGCRRSSLKTGIAQTSRDALFVD